MYLIELFCASSVMGTGPLKNQTALFSAPEESRLKCLDYYTERFKASLNILQTDMRATILSMFTKGHSEILCGKSGPWESD